MGAVVSHSVLCLPQNSYYVSIDNEAQVYPLAFLLPRGTSFISVWVSKEALFFYPVDVYEPDMIASCNKFGCDALLLGGQTIIWADPARQQCVLREVVKMTRNEFVKYRGMFRRVSCTRYAHHPVA